MFCMRIKSYPTIRKIYLTCNKKSDEYFCYSDEFRNSFEKAIPTLTKHGFGFTGVIEMR